MSKSIHRPEYAVLTQLLRQQRSAAGLHQADVADALGRTQSFVSDVESGTRRLDLIELRDVCKILGVDFQAFVGAVEAGIRALPARGSRGPRKASAAKRSAR